MATQEERFKLVLDLAQSSANVDELTQKIAQLGVTTDKAAKMAEQAWNSEALALSKMVVQVEELETTMRTTTTATRNFGQGALQASYAVQDFTSQLDTRGLAGALGAIQNNIPGILMSLGGPAGLVGLISVASVGAGLIYNNWDKLAKLWGEGGTEEEAKRMKDLAEATEKATEQADKLMKTQGQAQREAAEPVSRAIKYFGGADVQARIAELMVQKYGDFGKEANMEMARNLLANAEKGLGKAQQEIMELAGGHVDAISQVLAGGKTPLEEQKIRRQATEKQAKMADEAKAKAEKDAAKERERFDKETDMLNEQGANIQKRMENEQATERGEFMRHQFNQQRQLRTDREKKQREAAQNARRARQQGIQNQRDAIGDEIDQSQEFLRELQRSGDADERMAKAMKATPEMIDRLRQNNAIKEQAVQDYIRGLQNVSKNLDRSMQPLNGPPFQ